MANKEKKINTEGADIILHLNADQAKETMKAIELLLRLKINQYKEILLERASTMLNIHLTVKSQMNIPYSGSLKSLFPAARLSGPSRMKERKNKQEVSHG